MRNEYPDRSFDGQPLRTTRVLVVDDSMYWGEALCDFLQSHATIELVGSAANGAEALRSIQTLQPEVVLLDVQMEGMNGLETASHIRRRFPATRILMMSLCDDAATQENCSAHGADAFVSKTAGPDSIRDEIFRVCERPRSTAKSHKNQT